MILDVMMASSIIRGKQQLSSITSTSLHMFSFLMIASSDACLEREIETIEKSEISNSS
jgi:hypothetical protein